MLMIALYVIGSILLLIAAVTLLVGGTLALFLPQLIIGGLFLIIALAIERWRYKPVSDQCPIRAGPTPASASSIRKPAC